MVSDELINVLVAFAVGLGFVLAPVVPQFKSYALLAFLVAHDLLVSQVGEASHVANLSLYKLKTLAVLEKMLLEVALKTAPRCKFGPLNVKLLAKPNLA